MNDTFQVFQWNENRTVVINLISEQSGYRKDVHVNMSEFLFTVRNNTGIVHKLQI